MKNSKFNSALCALLSAAMCSFFVQSARAEGERDFGVGAHGVNRVVRTPGNLPATIPVIIPATDGYVGVKGKAALNFVMPYNTDSAATNRYPPEVNPLNNKPSMYLGGDFPPPVGANTRQADAGVQYEPSTFPDNNGNLAVRGWSVFLRVEGVGWRNPRIYDASLDASGSPQFPDGIPWRGGTESNGQGSIGGAMTLEALPQGWARFKFEGLQTTVAGNTSDEMFALANIPANRTNFIPSPTHPVAPWADAGNPATVAFSTNPNTLRLSNVKRVTAMTRRNGINSELDGSQLVGTWSECFVHTLGGVWQTWQWQQVNQGVLGADPTLSGTGYDAPLNGNLSVDKRFQGHPTAISQSIVQFASDPAVNTAMRAENHDNSTEPTQPGRYSAETTTINLGTLTRLMGEPLQ